MVLLLLDVGRKAAVEVVRGSDRFQRTSHRAARLLMMLLDGYFAG